MKGLQCFKQLHLNINEPSLARSVTPSEQARFDTGHQVGEEAQKKFPGGFLVDAPYYDSALAIQQTQEALAKGFTSIYEASFSNGSAFAKIDILNKPNDGWDIVEVKSTGRVKAEHIDDVAIQMMIFESQGLPLNKCFLMHLNSKNRYPNQDDLFILADITQEAKARIPFVKEKLKGINLILESKEEPSVDIGPHCNSPYSCPFSDHCRKGLPEKNIFQLPGLGKKAWGLYDKGSLSISDLNPTEFSGVTKRAIEATVSGERVIDKEAVKTELAQWQWPFYFLDFETIAPAIPRYEGTGPYSKVPFQYSCHLWRSPKDKELEHFEYLHTSNTDPREVMAKSLAENIGPEGSVIAYSMNFEKSVLGALASGFPKSKKALLSIVDRLVDPLPIFQSYVYDEEFLGSFSIKYVGPALIGEKLNYENLDISDGLAAGTAVESLIKGEVVDAVEIEKRIKSLLEYCRQDTLAMVE